MDPTTTATVDPLQALAALVVPFLIGGLRMAADKDPGSMGVLRGLLAELFERIPRRLIPLIVILGGVAVQYADAYARGVPFDATVAAGLGAAAIGVRETSEKTKLALADGLGKVLAAAKGKS